MADRYRRAAANAYVRARGVDRLTPQKGVFLGGECPIFVHFAPSKVPYGRFCQYFKLLKIGHYREPQIDAPGLKTAPDRLDSFDLRAACGSKSFRIDFSASRLAAAFGGVWTWAGGLCFEGFSGCRLAAAAAAARHAGLSC